MARNKIIQFGAGWEVVFVDFDPELLTALNKSCRYKVVVKEETDFEFGVELVHAVNARDIGKVTDEIKDSDFVSVSLEPSDFRRIASPITTGLAQREDPLNILVCGDGTRPAQLMREALSNSLLPGFPLTRRVGLLPTCIETLVPTVPAEVRVDDPLQVWADSHNQILVDKASLVADIPEIEGLVPCDCFSGYLDRITVCL